MKGAKTKFVPFLVPLRPATYGILDLGYRPWPRYKPVRTGTTCARGDPRFQDPRLLRSRFLESWIPEPGPVELAPQQSWILDSLGLLDPPGHKLYRSAPGPRPVPGIRGVVFTQPQIADQLALPLEDLLFSCGGVHPATKS